METRPTKESVSRPTPVINADTVYVMNPLFRMRDEQDHILIYGMQGIGTWRVHRSYGLLLSLFDGHRTVSQITDIVLPLVRGMVYPGKDEREIAFEYVKSFIAFMSMSKAEQVGRSSEGSPYPSEALLLSLKDYNEKFSHIPLFRVNYDPHSFLPDRSANRFISGGPFRVIHDSAPLSLNWHLTSSCSTDCKYCYLRRRKLNLLSYERLRQLIDEAVQIGVFEISLLGGDVLLYPHLTDVMELLHRHKFLPMSLSTKTFLSEEKAFALAKTRELLYEMQFSIDSDDAAVSEYLVGVADFPEKMFSSIDNAVRAGLNVATKSVITPHNLKTIPRLYRKLKERGVNRIRLAAYSRSGFHHTNDLFLTQEDFDWLNNEVGKLNSEFPDDNILVQNGQPDFERRSDESLKAAWPNRSMCTAGRVCMMICADGKVIPCEQMPETDEYFCGDLTTQTIAEVWNGDRLKEMTYGMPREKFQGLPCYDCDERNECHNVIGFCIRDLAVHYGDIYQTPTNCYKSTLPHIRMS